MPRKRLSPRFLLRMIGLGSMVVVAGALVVSFLSRSQKRLETSPVSSEIEAPKIDKKEQVRVVEFKKEKGIFQGRADKHYIGEDGLYHLEGNVEVTFIDRSDGEDVLLKGESIVHDQEWVNFLLTGNATVAFKDLVVESPRLEYDAETQVFTTDRGVRFSSERISGEALRCSYRLPAKKVELGGEVRIRLFPGGEDARELEIRAEAFDYFLGKGKGEASGNVRLGHGESRASAEKLTFELSASREQVKFLHMEGGVNLSLREEFGKGESFTGRAAVKLYSDRCDVRADEVAVRGFVDRPRIQRLEAEGRCSFLFLSGKGGSTRLQGRRVVFSLTGQGKLKELVAQGGVLLREEPGPEGKFRVIEGEMLSVEKSLMELEAGEDSTARISSPDLELTARWIMLNLSNGDIHAREEIEVVLHPVKNAVGFFPAGAPVFIAAGEMRYYHKAERFQFRDRVRAWQEGEVVTAGEMSLSLESGAFIATADVRSVLPYRPSEERGEEKVEIEGGTLRFDPGQDILFYQEKVRLKIRNITLTARTLQVELGEEGEGMKGVLAREDVVISRGVYEGRGKEARWAAATETITLVGRPVLIEKDKGKTEGGKLTFHLADDRIVMENKDGERSVTVIKS